MSNNADPHAIAAKLTKAQRESILDAQDMMFSRHGYPVFTVEVTKEPWPPGIANFLSLKMDTLTPLGLAVRAAIKEQDDAE